MLNSNMQRKPLPERLRPKSLDEYVGQEHLIGPTAILRKMIEAGNISSFILWISCVDVQNFLLILRAGKQK